MILNSHVTSRSPAAGRPPPCTPSGATTNLKSFWDRLAVRSRRKARAPSKPVSMSLLFTLSCFHPVPLILIGRPAVQAPRLSTMCAGFEVPGMTVVTRSSASRYLRKTAPNFRQSRSPNREWACRAPRGKPPTAERLRG